MPRIPIASAERLAASRTRACLDSSRVYHGCGQIDHGSEGLVGLVSAHGDTFELLQFAEEVLIRCRHLYISSSMARGFARRGCWEMTTLAPRASRSAIMALLSNAR